MSQELQAKDKVEVRSQGEQTRPGPVFVPPVDISESEDGMTLMADMPGVEKEGLTVDLKESVLTIHGQVEPPRYEGVKYLYREYQVGDFYRQFTLSEMIDQEKITATLKDGVLALFLPKVAPAQPRKIEVQIS
jgi:HSP20 family molecular chaperone IbpA